MTNLPTPAPPGGSLPATLVQHTAGPLCPRRRPETEAELQERLQRGRPAPPLDQVLHGGALLEHGHAAGHEVHERQEGESRFVLVMFCFWCRRANQNIKSFAFDDECREFILLLKYK